MVAPQGFGDPTLIGWTSFFIYFLATWLCYRASNWAGKRDPLAALWLGTAAILFLLGVNKQLDLQVWLGVGGRWITKALGCYEQRVWVQLGFAAAASITLLLGVAFLIRMGGRHLRRIPIAASGILLLAMFVLLRVITFDVVDLELVIAMFHCHELLEVTGSVLICVGALLFTRSDNFRLSPKTSA